MNNLDYRTPPASKSRIPRPTKHKNIIGVSILLLCAGGYVTFTAVQSSQKETRKREDQQSFSRAEREYELLKKKDDHGLSESEQAELTELQARDAKEKVDNLGR